mmetsp:Transcript_4064/g.13636  ORF Transcript_4064/g.13636 Transcript_4064/m.13636 type:complete len:402 (+) Transcript_4064:1423-2628(+)
MDLRHHLAAQVPPARLRHPRVGRRRAGAPHRQRRSLHDERLARGGPRCGQAQHVGRSRRQGHAACHHQRALLPEPLSGRHAHDGDADVLHHRRGARPRGDGGLGHARLHAATARLGDRRGRVGGVRRAPRLPRRHRLRVRAHEERAARAPRQAGRHRPRGDVAARARGHHPGRARGLLVVPRAGVLPGLPHPLDRDEPAAQSLARRRVQRAVGRGSPPRPRRGRRGHRRTRRVDRARHLLGAVHPPHRRRLDPAVDRLLLHRPAPRPDPPRLPPRRDRHRGCRGDGRPLPGRALLHDGLARHQGEPSRRRSRRSRHRRDEDGGERGDRRQPQVGRCVKCMSFSSMDSGELTGRTGCTVHGDRACVEMRGVECAPTGRRGSVCDCEIIMFKRERERVMFNAR